jgi:H+/Cl- antiporter ClcA
MKIPENSPTDERSREDGQSEMEKQGAEGDIAATSERRLEYTRPVQGMSGTEILLRTLVGLFALGIGFAGLAATVLGLVAIWDLETNQHRATSADVRDVIALMVCGIALLLVSFVWLKYVFRPDQRERIER